MSDQSIKVDRIAIREMLEDGYRSQILFQRNYIDTHPRSTPQESTAAAQEFFRRWTDRIDATAALMPSEQRAAFTDIVNEELEFLDQEVQRNSNAFYQRLGVNKNRFTPLPVYHRQGFGELAVRTALRATVWELIWSLFRR